MKPGGMSGPAPDYLATESSDTAPNQPGARLVLQGKRSDDVMFHQKAAQQPGLLGRCWA